MSDISQTLLDRIRALENKVKDNSLQAFTLAAQGVRRKTLAALGLGGDAGRLFFVTDAALPVSGTGMLYVDNGTSWVAVNAQATQSLTTIGARGVLEYTVAGLPNPPGLPAGYRGIAFATNGRKPTEGAGVGTGVLVYYNSSTSQWFRTADDTQVLA
jgi:hypothetical protein